LNSLPAFAAIISQVSDDVSFGALHVPKTVSCRQSIFGLFKELFLQTFCLKDIL